MNAWEKAQHAEQAWWGDCINTYQEESKQRAYATRLGLVEDVHDGHWPVYRLGGASVLDIGGGPISLLLKTIDRGTGCTVVDPCGYPRWVEERYRHAGITFLRARAEEIEVRPYDEVWVYNVLQHCEDPERVVRRALECAPLLRIFEWVDIPTDVYHISRLTAVQLDAWLGVRGTIEHMHGATAYYGYFRRSP